MSSEIERRRAVTYPRAHPHGWYPLADAADVRAGEVVPIEALGERWALFRNASGRIGLVHATCPHLGADLADGRVDGDCLTCPFHAWAFDCDGALRRIPNLDRTPKARAHAPPVRELHGLIVMWHGPVGPDRAPPYEPDEWPELATDRGDARGLAGAQPAEDDGAPPGAEAERRRAASYPSPTPAGWYHLADAADIRPGASDTVVALGERWQVYRTWTGEIGVRGATGATVPARERYGLVLAWPYGEPGYEPDLWPEIEAPGVVARGRYAPRDIRMHLLEFAENSVDTQHFARLHGEMRFPWTRRRIPGIDIHHVAGWGVDPERPYVVRFTDDAVLAPFGRAMPRTGARAEAMLVGPASLVMFRIAIPDLGDTWIAQTNTPVTGAGQPLQLRVRFRWWSPARRVPAPLAWYVAGNWVSQWWQDVDVWERKHHVRRPVLAKVDGPVHRLRRWFSQFYDDDEARRWLGLRARPQEARA